MAKSKGLGDDLKKVFDATGITKVVEKANELLGTECNCSNRQEWLNDKVSYNNETPKQNLTEQNIADFGEGIYNINNNIVFTRQGITYDYKVGDRIFIKQDHPLFKDFQTYFGMGIISKK